MKKLLLLVVFLVAASGIKAQDNPSRADLPKYIYCVLEELRGMSNTEVIVDFGQERSPLSSQKLRDQDGKPIKFNSLVDAMNFMAQDGWEFVQAFVTNQGGGNKQITSTTYWILKLNSSSLSSEEKAEILKRLNTIKKR